jgi:hypothetical protein
MGKMRGFCIFKVTDCSFLQLSFLAVIIWQLRRLLCGNGCFLGKVCFLLYGKGDCSGGISPIIDATPSDGEGVG